MSFFLMVGFLTAAFQMVFVAPLQGEAKMFCFIRSEELWGWEDDIALHAACVYGWYCT